MSQYIDSSLKRKYNGWLLKQVDHVASVSQLSKKDITGMYPFLRDQTSVLPIGVDITRPIKLISRTQDPTIVHVGGFTFEKDHESLIRIFQKVLDRIPEARLWLVGDGPLRPQIESLVSENNLKDKVSFFGYVSNPLDYTAAADVLVLPSKIEGLPGVILEAFYCKTPVVAYDTGGISEVLNTDTGFLIPSGDQKSFADAICYVLGDPDDAQMKQNSERAYQMVISTYANERVAENFYHLYKKLIDGH